MKIIYSANKFIGSNLRLSRILDAKYFEEVKILAYYNYSNKLHHIDWALDSLSLKPVNFFKDRVAPRCNKYYTELIIDEIISFKPDMIISDLEPISAYIAKLINIPLCYLSPLVGLFDENRFLPAYLKLFRKDILKYPKSNLNIIYHPMQISNKYDNVCIKSDFVDIVSSEDLNIKNKGLELSEFFKNDFVFNGGETDYITDAVINNKNIYIMPKFQDFEAMYNSYLINKFEFGIDIGLLNSSNELILENLNKELSFNIANLSDKDLKEILCL